MHRGRATVAGIPAAPHASARLGNRDQVEYAGAARRYGVEMNESTHRARVFTRWTGNREVLSLGTNDGHAPIAFQRWHKFKEAYAPELVAKAVASSPTPPARVYDPFGGSGTTALACQMLGVPATTVEVNPFLHDVIQAKTARYDVDRTAAALAQIRRRALRRPARANDVFANVPATFLPPGLNGRWIFDEEVADAMASILNAIDEIQDPDMVRLFRTLLGGILVDVSNVTVNGKGRRYRRGAQFGRRSGEEVHERFGARAGNALHDIIAFSDRPNVDATVALGDARTFQPPDEIGLSVFSPPYPNSFDYTDVYNLELWLLGYLRDSSDNQDLRRSTLSSHVQISRDFTLAPPGSPSLVHALEQLTARTEDLWSPWLPAMLGAYFADLLLVLDQIQPRLTPRSQVWLVVGDSQYAGVPVPVARILRELVITRGWRVLDSVSIRHMRSSAQQGGRKELPESLLILESSLP